MKNKSASRVAFFNSRVLIGFVLCSIGVLLAVAALSKSVASSLGVTQSTVREHGTARAPDQSKSNADWPQYGFDPEHTSFNPEETLLGTDNVSTLRVGWQYFSRVRRTHRQSLSTASCTPVAIAEISKRSML